MDKIDCFTLIGGIIGGLIAATIYQLINWSINRICNKIRYCFLHKSKWDGYWKNDNSHVARDITLHLRKGNQLEISGINLEKKDNTFSGCISMDKNLKWYGRGYYYDVEEFGYGFIEIQVNKKKKEVYTHMNFIKAKKNPKERKYVPQAFIWKLNKNK